MRKIYFEIGEKDDGRKIKYYLYDFGVSVTLLRRLKQTENGITLNGSPARVIDRLHIGDTLCVSIENRGSMPAPSGDGICILYEDEDLLAVDKPPFMPVHESGKHRGDALSNAAASHMPENAAFRAVYRLDRDTTGIVLIAKHELAAAKLAGNVKKDYYAIISGELSEGGVIDEPIKQISEKTTKRCCGEGGKRAVTRYEVIKHGGGLTLLKINLETGRTHQIRVHFSHIGMPLLGDTLYGSADERIGRQALHCKDIYFTHPVSGNELHITSDFPADFKMIADSI